MELEVELGIATPMAEGDRGTWDTYYIRIPFDTPDDQIEAVAIEAYNKKLVEHGDSPEISHMWLYHYGPADEDN